MKLRYILGYTHILLDVKLQVEVVLHFVLVFSFLIKFINTIFICKILSFIIYFLLTFSNSSIEN